MPPRKKKVAEEEVVAEEVDNSKYVAGKKPRGDSKVLPIDYNTPLDPDSELFKEQWSIPKLNSFNDSVLDNLTESYRALFKDFIKLPSRKFHPQYYYKIDKPISINEIKSRNYEFAGGAKTLLLDIELLHKNCAVYNEPDSLIVKNSLQIVNYIKYELLKAKNIERNYNITDDVRKKLLAYMDRLIEATDKELEIEFESGFVDVDDKIRLSAPFMELVDRDELGEYYEVIYRPMALSPIRKNLEVGLYAKIYDFIIDVHLVFQNALVFNDPETIIYQDAKKLLRFFNKIMNEKFFAELLDASERGEVKLVLDKSDFNQYLGPTIIKTSHAVLEDSEAANYDFNHVEGLGNGYTQEILSEDYLLGPSSSNTNMINKPSRKNFDYLPKVMKYNLLKSLKKEVVSSDHVIQHKPYEMINQVAIYSSKNYYSLAIRPLPGSRPACNQEWIEYIFNGRDLNVHENMFSFSLQPIQTFITLTADINDNTHDITLKLNKDIIPKNNQTNNSAQPVDENTKKLVSVSDKVTFDLRLNEGLNIIELNCKDNANNTSEVMKFWVNVLP
ncbi:hypothetical protein TPHA_0G03420 [Tetrapisispora phaffii CBS 4417]|uniref:Bromo domain-containing protein n=1 Tax=Tetrapisispora phaffii (strain ATCC 24235 / CBS 4417 / NBRC 1672 / NRRL Y-8282 / UCD 70-5) TaxID=1071381 RepID=G8BWA4_TETPH|nr:hypothetical protein TPHA_0G03420 [Tetrapisispora phaffii CBS 4417]CCE64182.1 hypothetical protein TPHA_0G03420 [Tetrapisispora phaffii CBS 4417]